MWLDEKVYEGGTYGKIAEVTFYRICQLKGMFPLKQNDLLKVDRVEMFCNHAPVMVEKSDNVLYVPYMFNYPYFDMVFVYCSHDNIHHVCFIQFTTGSNLSAKVKRIVEDHCEGRIAGMKTPVHMWLDTLRRSRFSPEKTEFHVCLYHKESEKGIPDKWKSCIETVTFGPEFKGLMSLFGCKE